MYAFHKGKSSFLYPYRKESYSCVVDFTRGNIKAFHERQVYKLYLLVSTLAPGENASSLLSLEDAMTCSV